MNKIYIISIIIAVVVMIGIGFSLNDTSSNDVNEATVDEVLDLENKHYSETLSESVKLTTP